MKLLSALVKLLRRGGRGLVGFLVSIVCSNVCAKGFLSPLGSGGGVFAMLPRGSATSEMRDLRAGGRVSERGVA